MDFDRDFGINQVSSRTSTTCGANQPAAVSSRVGSEYVARLHGVAFAYPRRRSS